VVAQRGFGYPLLVWALELPHRPESSILKLWQQMIIAAHSLEPSKISIFDGTTTSHSSRAPQDSSSWSEDSSAPCSSSAS
jgi:hypothetical protein